MEDMIERVARADAEFCNRDFDALGRADKRRFMDRAAFMIAAMWEPTEAMKQVGSDHFDNEIVFGSTSQAQYAWQAMLDAALATQNTEES
jgi:hypothetical protein